MDELFLKNVTGSEVTIYGYGVDIVAGATHQFVNGEFVARILRSIEIYEYIKGGSLRVVIDGSVLDLATSLVLWRNNMVMPMPEVTTAPTVNDDASKGFSPGDQWLKTDTDAFYKCASNAVGAARWVSINA